jgi:hypothetical protein
MDLKSPAPRRCNPCNNTFNESFMKTIKTEEVSLLIDVPSALSKQQEVKMDYGKIVMFRKNELIKFKDFITIYRGIFWPPIYSGHFPKLLQYITRDFTPP